LLQRETLTVQDFPAMSSRHPGITLPAAESVDLNADGLQAFSDAMWEGWPAPTNSDQHVLRSASEESGPHIRMLADLGLDRDEIVAYTGFSGSHVENAMSQDHAEIEWTSGICRARHQSKHL
jgi:hypothetical protein